MYLLVAGWLDCLTLLNIQSRRTAGWTHGWHLHCKCGRASLRGVARPAIVRSPGGRQGCRPAFRYEEGAKRGVLKEQRGSAWTAIESASSGYPTPSSIASRHLLHLGEGRVETVNIGSRLREARLMPHLAHRGLSRSRICARGSCAKRVRRSERGRYQPICAGWPRGLCWTWER